jgi:ArsR family transcriptional regulator, lead/cadmium/zinc/bismuth-responsive transcriptional repressor
MSAHPCERADVPVVSPSHPVDEAAVTRAQAGGLGAGEAEQLGRLLGLLSDPTRVRVLFCLVAVDELCVGDLALSLDISVDQSSYALKQLRGAGLVQSRRDGRLVHYRLADGFPHQLLDHCLRQLLTIASEEDRA